MANNVLTDQPYVDLSESIPGYVQLVAGYLKIPHTIRRLSAVALLSICVSGVFALITNEHELIARMPDTKSAVAGYEHYTPNFWLLAIFTGWITGFAIRYSGEMHSSSPSGDSRRGSRSDASSVGHHEKAARWIENQTAKPWIQLTLIVIMGTILAVEFAGLRLPAPNSFTISGVTRNYALNHTWMYWVFGIVTGLLLGMLVDLRIPVLSRAIIVVLIATSAHIFWWITPLPDSTFVRGDAADIEQSLKDHARTDSKYNGSITIIYGPYDKVNKVNLGGK